MPSYKKMENYVAIPIDVAFKMNLSGQALSLYSFLLNQELLRRKPGVNWMRVPNEIIVKATTIKETYVCKLLDQLVEKKLIEVTDKKSRNSYNGKYSCLRLIKIKRRGILLVS